MANDVITHAGSLVIVLVCVHWCFSLPNQDGFLLGSSVRLFINDFRYELSHLYNDVIRHSTKKVDV